MSATPVPTFYNGYLFRSRLEARWAVFFDKLGVKYQYERETWDVDPWYLPDFYLPEQECWVEIKGPTPTMEEKRKAAALADVVGQTVYVCQGDPYDPTVIEYVPDAVFRDGTFRGWASAMTIAAIADNAPIVASMRGLASGWQIGKASFYFAGCDDWWIDQLAPEFYDFSNELVLVPISETGLGLQMRARSGCIGYCPRCRKLLLGVLTDWITHTVFCSRLIDDDADGGFDVPYGNAATSARSTRFEGKSIVYVSGVQGGRVDVARVPAYA